jgi:hypothetical protein
LITVKSGWNWPGNPEQTDQANRFKLTTLFSVKLGQI